MSKIWTYAISIGVIFFLFLTFISPWKLDDIAGILACIIAMIFLLKEIFTDTRNWFSKDETEKEESTDMTWLTYNEKKKILEK